MTNNTFTPLAPRRTVPAAAAQQLPYPHSPLASVDATQEAAQQKGPAFRHSVQSASPGSILTASAVSQQPSQRRLTDGNAATTSFETLQGLSPSLSVRPYRKFIDTPDLPSPSPAEVPHINLLPHSQSEVPPTIKWPTIDAQEGKVSTEQVMLNAIIAIHDQDAAAQSPKSVKFRKQLGALTRSRFVSNKDFETKMTTVLGQLPPQALPCLIRNLEALDAHPAVAYANATSANGVDDFKNEMRYWTDVLQRTGFVRQTAKALLEKSISPKYVPESWWSSTRREFANAGIPRKIYLLTVYPLAIGVLYTVSAALWLTHSAVTKPAGLIASGALAVAGLVQKKKRQQHLEMARQVFNRFVWTNTFKTRTP